MKDRVRRVFWLNPSDDLDHVLQKRVSLLGLLNLYPMAELETGLVGIVVVVAVAAGIVEKTEMMVGSGKSGWRARDGHDQDPSPILYELHKTKRTCKTRNVRNRRRY